MQKSFEVRYTEHALKDLKAIDRTVARRIAQKVKENTQTPNPLVRAKLLTGPLSDIYRYRVGDYRVLFELLDKNTVTVLMVLRVKHRKDVYR